MILMCISFCDFHCTSKPAEHRGQDLPDLSTVRLKQTDTCSSYVFFQPCAPCSVLGGCEGIGTVDPCFRGRFLLSMSSEHVYCRRIRPP